MPDIASEVRRRRTFAIISHPDAGKTTLTEKLLLFSGAIQIAGSVKARKASRHATSDWMEIEKQRGISVASSVMQMEYRGAVINLLDTPGHQDFSEDTYRVLTAVDAALMVIDAANGVEPQTRRLLQVCRARITPILTFVNKMDREVQRAARPDGGARARARHGGRALHLAGRHGQAFPRRDGPARAADARLQGRPGPRRREGRRRRDPRRPGQPGLRRALRRLVRAGRGRDRAARRCGADVRPRRLPRRPADADVLRLGGQQLRRPRGARRARRPRAAAGRTPGAAAHRRPGRAAPDRRRLQDPGEHGSGAPRPDRLRPGRLGPLRARHAPEGRALGQGDAAEQRRQLSLAAARAARRGVRRRHHRHSRTTACCNSATRSAKARRCSTRGCRSSRPRCSDRSRSPTRCAPSSCAPA